MASCDLCSKPATTKARIEGVVLSVCASCAAFGTEFKAPPPILKRPVVHHATPTTLLVTDFATRLRKARQKLGLNEEDAARKLNIRKSTLLHFEAGKLQPDDATTKKLEKFYGITLLETDA